MVFHGEFVEKLSLLSNARASFIPSFLMLDFLVVQACFDDLSTKGLCNSCIGRI